MMRMTMRSQTHTVTWFAASSLLLWVGSRDWLRSGLVDAELDAGSLALVLFVGAILGALLERRRGKATSTATSSAELEARLAEHSRALEASHNKLRAIEQEQAIANERQRLMREMHDGLGSALMSSLVMVEHGKLDQRQIADVLRESIDDLKLTIDSLEPMGEDLLTLLGTLRYRLGKRLESAGIKLEWRVQETPPLAWLNPTSSLQILRILQEALTNTLKHARASTIRVETSVEQDAVVIRLVDNGVGFDVSAVRANPTGRGLQNLERRAATLSGRVSFQSQSGTTVTLRLPLERRATPRVGE